MNDNTKTITFVVVAVAVLLIAWVSRPSLPGAAPQEMVGELLVGEFDPLSATTLEILKYDEDSATVHPFKVAQAGGVWAIPSHNNYPADAKDHLAEAAAGLLGQKILSVATESPGEHEIYGVLDPDPQNPKKGMGTSVAMKDKDGKVLLALVIGKEVPGKSELHYVRRAAQDPVYTAAIKTDKLSTKFEDWIEKDLLKMNTWDIKEVQIRDHSVDVLNMALIQRSEMTLAYNDTGDSHWKMLKDEVFQGDKWVPVKMSADEEINASKLDDMKFALDDLKIVDVNPKPSGLSAELKAAESFMNNREAVDSLADRGFYVARLGDQVQLFSNEGEIRALMKDGVEYVLRFGGIAGTSSASKADKEKKAEKEGDKEKEGGKDKEKSATAGLNRFIFVTTEFNPEAIEKPKLEPLPEEKPEAKPEAAKPDAAKPAEKKPDEKKADLKAEREQVEKENKRKQDEYQEKLEKGKKHVQELNDRFADWYYIIPDDVYAKTHLSRKDIVKKKEKKEEGKKEGEDHQGHDHAEKPEKPGNTPSDFENLKGKVPPPSGPPLEPQTPAPKPETPTAKPAAPAAKPKP